MEEETFQDCTVERYAASGDPRGAVLFLHGLPADSGKNEDVARALAVSRGVDCFVLHYPGLGRSGGRFGFEHTLRVLYRFLQGRVLAANYPRIHLVGHSFGGMFALFMAKAIPDERRGGATLLAPVVDLPAKGEVRPMLQRIFESRVSYDLAELEADFERIRDRASPRAVARDLRAKVRIIQGTRDTVCPPDGARALARILGAELTLTDDDHWFPDRERLARIVSESVAG